MNKNGFKIISGTKKYVEDMLNVMASDKAFEIYDIKFSTASENYGNDDYGMCYSVLVLYKETIK